MVTFDQLSYSQKLDFYDDLLKFRQGCVKHLKGEEVLRWCEKDQRKEEMNERISVDYYTTLAEDEKELKATEIKYKVDLKHLEEILSLWYSEHYLTSEEMNELKQEDVDFKKLSQYD